MIMEHIKIFESIILLILGLFLIFSIRSDKSKTISKIQKYVLSQLLIIISMLIIFIITKYIGVNVSKSIVGVHFSYASLFLQLSLGCIALYYRYTIKILLNLIGKESDRPVEYIIDFLIIISLLSIIVSILIPTGTIKKAITVYQQYFCIFIVLSEIIILAIAPAIKGFHVQNRVKPILRAFILLYLIRYIYIALLIPFSLYFNLNIVFDPLGFLMIILFYMLPPYIFATRFKETLGIQYTGDHNDLAFQNLLSKYKLTKREDEIIRLILKGYSNKDIEEHLSISYSTVKNHLYNIYRKFGVYSRLEISTLLNNLLRLKS